MEKLRDREEEASDTYKTNIAHRNEDIPTYSVVPQGGAQYIVGAYNIIRGSN